MAFWALYKWFRPFSKRGYPNMIYYYREYVLKTPKQREEERKERRRNTKNALLNLSLIYSCLSNVQDRSYYMR